MRDMFQYKFNLELFFFIISDKNILILNSFKIISDENYSHLICYFKFGLRGLKKSAATSRHLGNCTAVAILLVIIATLFTH